MSSVGHTQCFVPMLKKLPETREFLPLYKAQLCRMSRLQLSCEQLHWYNGFPQLFWLVTSLIMSFRTLSRTCFDGLPDAVCLVFFLANKYIYFEKKKKNGFWQ